MPSSNLPWLMFKAAATTTINGGAITLTSTMVSCALACYIERGAHRAVYRYFPEKYANVEHANGLTQDQLNAVRIYRQDPAVVVAPEAAPTAMSATTTTLTSLRDEEEEFRHDLESRTTALRPNSDNGFWKEEASRRETSAPAFSWKPQESFRSAEILACAMTG